MRWEPLALASGRPDETVGQLRFTGILVTRRVSEGCNSLPRLRVGLPFRQASLGPYRAAPAALGPRLAPSAH